MASSYFLDLEAEYIAAATDDGQSAQTAQRTGSVWGNSAPEPAAYAIGVTEEIVITEEMAAGYLMDDPFDEAYQVAVITSVIAIVQEVEHHGPSEGQVQDALGAGYLT